MLYMFPATTNLVAHHTNHKKDGKLENKKNKIKNKKNEVIRHP